jgi:hypothetical protein
MRMSAIVKNTNLVLQTLQKVKIGFRVCIYARYVFDVIYCYKSILNTIPFCVEATQIVFGICKNSKNNRSGKVFKSHDSVGQGRR